MSRYKTVYIFGKARTGRDASDSCALVFCEVVFVNAVNKLADTEPLALALVRVRLNLNR